MRSIILVIVLLMGCAPVEDGTIPRCNINWMETYISKCVEPCEDNNYECEETCVDFAKEKYCN